MWRAAPDLKHAQVRQGRHLENAGAASDVAGSAAPEEDGGAGAGAAAAAAAGPDERLQQLEEAGGVPLVPHHADPVEGECCHMGLASFFFFNLECGRVFCRCRTTTSTAT